MFLPIDPEAGAAIVAKQLGNVMDVFLDADAGLEIPAAYTRDMHTCLVTCRTCGKPVFKEWPAGEDRLPAVDIGDGGGGYVYSGESGAESVGYSDVPLSGGEDGRRGTVATGDTEEETTDIDTDADNDAVVSGVYLGPDGAKGASKEGGGKSNGSSTPREGDFLVPATTNSTSASIATKNFNGTETTGSAGGVSKHLRRAESRTERSDTAPGSDVPSFHGNDERDGVRRLSGGTPHRSSMHGRSASAHIFLTPPLSDHVQESFSPIAATDMTPPPRVDSGVDRGSCRGSNSDSESPFSPVQSPPSLVGSKSTSAGASRASIFAENVPVDPGELHRTGSAGVLIVSNKEPQARSMSYCHTQELDEEVDSFDEVGDEIARSPSSRGRGKMDDGVASGSLSSLSSPRGAASSNVGRPIARSANTSVARAALDAAEDALTACVGSGGGGSGGTDPAGTHDNSSTTVSSPAVKPNPAVALGSSIDGDAVTPGLHAGANGANGANRPPMSIQRKQQSAISESTLETIVSGGNIEGEGTDKERANGEGDLGPTPGTAGLRGGLGGNGGCSNEFHEVREGEVVRLRTGSATDPSSLTLQEMCDEIVHALPSLNPNNEISDMVDTSQEADDGEFLLPVDRVTANESLGIAGRNMHVTDEERCGLQDHDNARGGVSALTANMSSTSLSQSGPRRNSSPDSATLKRLSACSSGDAHIELPAAETMRSSDNVSAPPSQGKDSLTLRGDSSGTTSGLQARSPPPVGMPVLSPERPKTSRAMSPPTVSSVASIASSTSSSSSSSSPLVSSPTAIVSPTSATSSTASSPAASPSTAAKVPPSSTVAVSRDLPTPSSQSEPQRGSLRDRLARYREAVQKQSEGMRQRSTYGLMTRLGAMMGAGLRHSTPPTHTPKSAAPVVLKEASVVCHSDSQ